MRRINGPRNEVYNDIADLNYILTCGVSIKSFSHSFRHMPFSPSLFPILVLLSFFLLLLSFFAINSYHLHLNLLPPLLVLPICHQRHSYPAAAPPSSPLHVTTYTRSAHRRSGLLRRLLVVHNRRTRRLMTDDVILVVVHDSSAKVDGLSNQIKNFLGFMRARKNIREYKGHFLN